MPRAAVALENFTAGQLSPRLDGRTDIQRYHNGCKTLENMLVHPHGGATRRPGTVFVSEVKTSANTTRLIPFEFGVTATADTYILEFGNLYFRIYRNFGQVQSSGSAVEITTTYTSAQLAQLKFTQSADVMYVTHPEHAPRKISRTGHTTWTITDVDLKRGPMQDDNTTDTTLVASARSGSITLTASADLFVSTDVGRLVRVHNGFAKITAFTNATTVTAAVQENEAGDAELLPSYATNTIAFKEGDPSSTGLEHNDRITDSNKAFITEGFENGQKVTITGASTSGNNSTNLIVSATADTILFAPSDDVADEGASATVTINGTLEASKDFALGAFSTTTGFPAAVCFYEERLVFAGTTSQPQTIFLSQSGDFENFEDGVEADDGMVYTMGSNDVNVVRYLASARSLIVGTTGGEFVVSAGDTDEAITPTNIQIKRQSSYGSADIQPVQVAGASLFVQRAKRKMREFSYNFNTDGYHAPDMTILAENVTESGIKEIALQQEPDNIIWAVRNDGLLIGMTYRRDENVVAWHQHKIGGVSGAATVTVTDFANIAVGTTIKLTKSDGETITFTSEAVSGSAPSETNGWRPNTDNNTTADNIFTAINANEFFTVANPGANVVTIKETARAGVGFLSVETSDTIRLVATSQSHALVESVATIPGDLDEDEVWVIVQRTINGATKRYIEYFKSFEFGTDIEDAFFLDSGLSYTGSSATTLSGLTHLEGESVTILANGATHPNKSVASGAITLDRSTTKAHVGLGFTSTLQSMRLDAGAADGTSQGKIKRIHDVTVRLYRSVGVKVGSSVTQTDIIPFRSSADDMGQAVPLFSGDKTVEFDGGFDEDGFVVVIQDQALPLTVLSLYPRLTTFDD